MTESELHWAFVHESPVVYQGALYKRISAVIFRKAERPNMFGERLFKSAELVDANEYSTVLARISDIEIAHTADGQPQKKGAAKCEG